MQTQKAPHGKLVRLRPGAIAAPLSLNQIRVAQAGSAQTPGLTPREAEVMACVCLGKTNKDIGAILRISPRTVQKHLEHVYQKFGVEMRTAAAIAAVEHLPTFLYIVSPYFLVDCLPDSLLDCLLYAI